MKDINTRTENDQFTDGYVNGIYVKKGEGSRAECYWRKLYDDKYICYLQDDYGMYASRNYAIQYPGLQIKEQGFPVAHNIMDLFANDRYVMAVGTSMMGGMNRRFLVSEDGKLFRMHETEKYIFSRALVQDGFIYSAYNDSGDMVDDLRHVEIGDGLEAVRETAINGAAGKKWERITALAGGADGCFAEDGEGTVYFVNKNGIKRIASRSGITFHAMAYGGGKYYVLYSFTTYDSGTGENLFTCRLMESSTGSVWINRQVFTYKSRNLKTSRTYNMLTGIMQDNIYYREGKFLLYMYNRFSPSEPIRWQVCSTRDFRSFTHERTSPSYMILPVIPTGRKLLLSLGEDCPSKRELGLGEDHDASPLYSYLNFGSKAQFRNGKNVPLDCLYFSGRHFDGLGVNTDYFGVYIDNMLFGESGGNYAVDPAYGSFGSIIDYTHGNGGKT
ncbi:MAG: hypothetical protein NC489_19625 [Ruminococcus flavefaciens]|nr:hypothetical protein [Ruminococcus flavefaciens]